VAVAGLQPGTQAASKGHHQVRVRRLAIPPARSVHRQVHALHRAIQLVRKGHHVPQPAILPGHNVRHPDILQAVRVIPLVRKGLATVITIGQIFTAVTERLITGIM
jgi:hypothetical protein